MGGQLLYGDVVEHVTQRGAVDAADVAAIGARFDKVTAIGRPQVARLRYQNKLHPFRQFQWQHLSLLDSVIHFTSTIDRFRRSISGWTAAI